MKKIAVLLAASLLFFTAKPVQAVQFKNSTDITFSKDQKIDETLFVSGKNINFDGTLNGDLYCVGQNITITGSIKGDIICAGQYIKVSGVVDGNIRLASQTVDIEGLVTRNISVLSQKLTLGSKSNVKGDILFGAQAINLTGVGGRDVAGAGQDVLISGSLLRNAVVTVSNMQVTNSAKIAGSMDYFVDQTDVSSLINIDPNSIKGAVRKHEIIRPQKPDISEVEKKVKEVKPGLEIFGKIMGIISFTLLTFVLIYFNRQRTNKVLSFIKQKPVISGLIGLAVLFVAPLALFILCITIVGLPIALVLLLVYLLSLFISSLYATLLVGSFLLEKMYAGKPYSIYLAAFVGCLVVGLVSLIPVIGWLLMFVIFLLGLGASFLTYLPEAKQSHV